VDVLPRLVASENPKRGVAARSQQPIKTTPTAFNVQIINKAKGTFLNKLNICFNIYFFVLKQIPGGSMS
jgi:hypothetical protein